MLVVAVAGWANRRAGLPRVRVRLVGAAAGAAGVVARVVLTAVVASRAVTGLLLISYGAWLAYRPAGFVVAGVLLLADRLTDAPLRGETG